MSFYLQKEVMDAIMGEMKDVFYGDDSINPANGSIDHRPRNVGMWDKD